ncbi:MAG: adenosylcobinamide-GDP ribazoletransferase, partial [Synergistaceae bacterium]|nr:adenosylcobinamide-GDP ribazoletransferase [Synergistaceae bacterium]
GGYIFALMIKSFLIVFSFISAIPIPVRFIPSWTPGNLRYFCVMLPVAGVIFGLLWAVSWQILSYVPAISPTLRGFVMMILTLATTGGLHLDGLMDTCDAIFSRRDRETRLKILSDTHAGSFAVMACVIALMAKTLLFAELVTLHTTHYPLLTIPIYSRLGMAFILNNLPFAKSGGLAVMLGSSRNRRDNLALLAMFLAISFMSGLAVMSTFTLCLACHVIICLQVFGGITGDLLGAFVEASEIFMLSGMVIMSCI